MMYVSHESLRSDYRLAVLSSTGLGSSEDIAGVVGARMTGGGFGGCTINLIKEASLGAFEETVKSRYQSVFGSAPAFLTVRPSDGARELAVG